MKFGVIINRTLIDRASSSPYKKLYRYVRQRRRPATAEFSRLAMWDA